MSDVIRSGTDCNFLDEFIKDYNTLKINNNISIYPNNEHNCSTPLDAKCLKLVAAS